MMIKKSIFLFLSVVFVTAVYEPLMAQAPTPDDWADSILSETNVKGGLIVHLGCGEGRLTMALGKDASYRVHGLDKDASDISRARQLVRSAGRYGPVSFEQWDKPYLPYGDNLVNLLVAEELGDITMGEVMRVLAPRGVVYYQQDGTWRQEIKPTPNSIDEWTHFLHDAGGNAVAHDQVVGPPKHLQWITGPRHTRSHEHIPSINALVSTGGRIFYVADEAPVGSIRQTPQWALTARGAYNGLLLWERPFENWFPHIVNWGQTPRELQRRLVAAGDRIYVTLGYHAPLSALDAVTGKTVKVYENTEGTEEIICHQGILLLAVRRVTEQRRAEYKKIEQLTRQDNSPLYKREDAQPLVSRFRGIENKTEKRIMALEAESGRLLWEKNGAEASGLRTQSLCAHGDRAFYQNGKDILCFNMKTGRPLWSTASATLRLVCDSGVYCVGGGEITVRSLETGKVRWSQEPLLTDIRDVFVAGDSLWLGGFKPIEGKRGPSWGPYFVTQRDPASGKVLRHVEPYNPSHHHRCYQNKATDRFILAGRRGIEFFDLTTGDMREHSWVRGVCRYGVMPCNGLVYAPPHACACYVGTKLSGFSALAASQEAIVMAAGAQTGKAPVLATDSSQQPIIRAAFQTSTAEPVSVDSLSWSTYRHDAGRSGYTPASVKAELQPKWQTDLGSRPTAPTLGSGKVYLACPDWHEVVALDSESGKTVWMFTANGPVDSPPTVYGERVLFGSRDGSVYCLQASDGSLAWRFQDAPAARRIMAHGQLESASPAHGSVLIQNGVAFFTTGRSSYLDGGINLYRLDPATGAMLSKSRIYSPDPETGKQPPQSAPYLMPGVRSDILSGDDRFIYLRTMVFDLQGREQAEGNDHLFTLTDFLDDAWAHRSYWIFGKECSISTGCSGRRKDTISGRLLAFNESTIYGYGRKSLHWSNQLRDGAYRVFALKADDKTMRWERIVDIQVRALVVAGNIMFAAGPTIDAVNFPDARSQQAGAVLLALDGATGEILSRRKLDSVPVFDSMAAIPDRLCLTLENNSVICLQ